MIHQPAGLAWPPAGQKHRRSDVASDDQHFVARDGQQVVVDDDQQVVVGDDQQKRGLQ